jgi:hypothetical protein
MKKELIKITRNGNDKQVRFVKACEYVFREDFAYKLLHSEKQNPKELYHEIEIYNVYVLQIQCFVCGLTDSLGIPCWLIEMAQHYILNTLKDLDLFGYVVANYSE